MMDYHRLQSGYKPALEVGDAAKVSRFNRIRKAAVLNSLIHPTLFPLSPYILYLCALQFQNNEIKWKEIILYTAPSTNYHSAIFCNSSFELIPNETTIATKSTCKQTNFLTERFV